MNTFLLSWVAPVSAMLTIIIVGFSTSSIFRNWLGPDYHRTFIYNFFLYVTAFGVAVFVRSLLPLEGNSLHLGLGLAIGMAISYFLMYRR